VGYPGKKRLALILCVITAALILFGTGDGLFAADIKLQNLNGKEVSPGEYTGKQPVIMFFWASWCPYCQRDLKELNQAAPKLKEKGIAVLTVDLGESKARVARFMQVNALSLEVLLDENGDFSDSYGVFGIPTFIIFDKNGKEASRRHAFPKDYL